MKSYWTMLDLSGIERRGIEFEHAASLSNISVALLLFSVLLSGRPSFGEETQYEIEWDSFVPSEFVCGTSFYAKKFHPDALIIVESRQDEEFVGLTSSRLQFDDDPVEEFDLIQISLQAEVADMEELVAATNACQDHYLVTWEAERKLLRIQHKAILDDPSWPMNRKVKTEVTLSDAQDITLPIKLQGKAVEVELEERRHYLTQLLEGQRDEYLWHFVQAVRDGTCLVRPGRIYEPSQEAPATLMVRNKEGEWLEAEPGKIYPQYPGKWPVSSGPPENIRDEGQK